MRKLNKIKIVIAALFVGLLGFSPLASFAQNVDGVTDQGESTKKTGGSYVNENGKFVCWPRVTSNGQLLTYGPLVDTEDPSDITSTTVTLHGNILHDGWCNGITGQGFQISLDADFTMIVTTVVTSPVHTFNPCNNYPICTCNNNQYTEPVTGLTPGVTYYYRAYATNDCGTGYGDTLSFTTENSLTVTVTGDATLQFCPGGSGSVTYTATLTPAMSSPSYQWYVDGTAVSGETNATFTATYNTTGTKSVKCVVSVSGLTPEGSMTTTVSNYTVPALAISAPDDPICVGGAGNLTATTGFSSYTWSSNVASYSTNTATYTAAGTYSVTATTSNGCTANASKTVTVSDPQVVSASAISGTTTICSGSTTTLTANATASTGATLHYQWYKDGSLISSATSASYTTDALTADATYTCSITAVQDGCTSAATNKTVTVTVNTPTLSAVTISPSPVNICSGETATMTASATGNGTLSYQWKKGSSNVATTASYTTGALTTGGTYTCKVTNNYNGCEISNTATVTVNVYTPSVGTLSLAGTTVCYDEPATLTVSASGNNGTLTYQWATGGSDISGATNSSYTTPNLTAATDYTAYVTATINTPVTCTATGNVTATVNVYGPYDVYDTVKVCDCQFPFSLPLGTWTPTWTDATTPAKTQVHTYTSSTDCDSVVHITLELWDAQNETATTCNVSNIRSNEVGTAGALSELVDVEGHHYKVVQIGNQCWMKENLRVKKFSDGRPLTAVNNVSFGNRADIYYSKSGSISSRGVCEQGTPLSLEEYQTRYGLMYNWYTAMDNANPDYDMHNVQGICPTGWHLPDTTEWQTLERNIGFFGQHSETDHVFVGHEAIKLVTGCEWEESNTPGSPGDYDALGRNATHFSARPAGCFLDHDANVETSLGTIHYDANTFAYVGNWAFFWSCTRYKKGTHPAGKAAYNYDISFDRAGIARDVNGEDYLIGRSVRCIRDVSTLKVRIENAINTSATEATITADVWDLGSTACDERGVCWSTSHNPTIADNHTQNGMGGGTYTANITGMTAGTTYYVRAYAHDGEGYVYSNEITLPITAPVVLTTTVTKQSNTKATLSGDITTLGDVSCVAGICLSTSANPTIADTYQSITVTSTGEYSIDFTGLTAGTTYHYRAYAHNSSGEAYGADATFVAAPCNGLATISDIQGNDYEVVAIGSQCWTQRSMHTTKYADGTDIDFGSPYYSGTDVHNSNNHYSTSTGYYYTPYNNNDATSSTTADELIQKYGYLYNWKAATKGESGDNVQGVCPDGWHVPTSTEWNSLKSYASQHWGCSASGTNHDAKALSSTESWESSSTACTPGYNRAQNNGSGFNAYPAGIYNPNQGYVLHNQFVNFWTSTYEYYTAIGYQTQDMGVNTTGDWQKFAFYVRCVKD